MLFPGLTLVAKGTGRERARWLFGKHRPWVAGWCTNFCSASILDALGPPCPTEVLRKGSCLLLAPPSLSSPIKRGAIKCFWGVWDPLLTWNRESVHHVCCRSELPGSPTGVPARGLFPVLGLLNMCQHRNPNYSPTLTPASIPCSHGTCPRAGGAQGLCFVLRGDAVFAEGEQRGTAWEGTPRCSVWGGVAARLWGFF